MSPAKSPHYYYARRLNLIRARLCVNGQKHGPALPMRTTCARCTAAIKIRNARRNPLRIRKVKGES